MSLELTEEEQALLAQLLENAWRDLKEEIYKAEDYAYKRGLKDDERIITGLLAKVKQLRTEEPPAVVGEQRSASSHQP